MKLQKLFREIRIITSSKNGRETYEHSQPIRRLFTQAEYDRVHPRRWNGTKEAVDDIEGNQIAPYGNML